MNSKRKSGGAVGAGDALDDRDSKRRKLPNNDSDALTQGETAQTTTLHGLKLVETLRKTEDKNGRIVATAFFTLPSKRSLPDYYQVTRMPIALDDVEKKLKRGEFPTLTTLESYLKRMVQNAKEYNQKGSQVYEDAERVRKAVSNFMVKTNPAYKSGTYTSFPTPFPEVKEESTSAIDAEEDLDEVISKKKGKAAKNPRRRSSVTPALSESYVSVGYTGLTFQQAQEKIMEDLLREKELPDDDFLAFADFVELPPRSLKDYYRAIKNPTSLLSLQKRVKGTHKKTDIAGFSEFRTWAAFEEEASHLWKNAFFYNEDGSEISVRAGKLQQSFYKYLKEAKSAVPDPVAPKIKLKLAEPAAPAPTPKFTLKLASKASPAVTPAPPTNGSSSSSNPVTNGTSSRRNPFSAAQPSATPIPLEKLERAKSVSDSVASPSPSVAAPPAVVAAPVKKEEVARNSPALVAAPNGLRSASQTSSTPAASATGMAPPSTPGLSSVNTYSSAGYAQSFPHQPQFQQPIPVYESKWRQPGQNPMITNLNLATHPGLNISRHFKMDIPASSTLTQQSITINLPTTHYYLQVNPVIAPALLDRQHKVFVTCGSRLHALPLINGQPIDPQNAVYDARLHPGVNRIEVEIIAALPKGAKPINGQDYETEKFTVFANLIKA